MNKSYSIFSIVLLSVIIIFSSCTKDDEKTPKDFLIDGQWRITDVELDPGIEIIPGVPIKDVYDLFITQDCAKDDLIIFNADGTITEDEGPTKCDPDDPQSVTENTWSMNEEQTTISATFFGLDSGSADIIALNENIFIFSTTALPDFATQFGIENQTITVTMTKQ